MPGKLCFVWLGAMAFIWGCAGTELRRAKVELERSRDEQAEIAALGVSDSLAPKTLAEAESSWVRAERAWPWQKRPWLRRLRAELLLERLRWQALAEQKKGEEASFQERTWRALYQEALLLVQESGLRIPALDTAISLTEGEKRELEMILAPYQMQWALLEAEDRDLSVYGDRVSAALALWSEMARRRVIAQRRSTALQQATMQLRQLWQDRARESLRQKTERIAVLEDSIFHLRRVWQQKYEELLQKAASREFIKDQLYASLSELRLVADTALSKIAQCRQSLELFSAKAEQSYRVFLGAAVLGLRGAIFEDGRYILSADRGEMLDKSLEMLAVFWPGSRIDAVHWVDTNSFSAETTLVAELVMRRQSFLQNRVISGRGSGVDTARLQLRGCVRHALVQDSASGTTRALRDFGEVSLVLSGPYWPETFAMDSAQVCGEDEIALLKRGALPRENQPAVKPAKSRKP